MAKVYGHEEQPKVLTSDELNYLIYRYLQETGECGGRPLCTAAHHAA